MTNVVVTGGSGFLGRRLQKKFPEWKYMSSKLYDFTITGDAECCFADSAVDTVLHLAGFVGGIKENNSKQADYCSINNLINSNVLNEAHYSGIPRVLSSLSTCAFPDVVDKYPFTEEDLHKGPPAKTNFSYGYTKRMLQVHSKAIREQYGLNYSTFAPSNLYGPGDSFESEGSHFVAALVGKLYKAKDGDTIEFWGTGKPLRQPLYVDDLCDIIGILLEKHNTDIPLIVAPNENLSIETMIKKAIKVSGKKVNYTFNGELDGQYRKDGSNKKLLELIGDYKFTTFEEGFKKTYESYAESKCQQR